MGAIFSQNRDELILTFSNDREDYTIKAMMGAAFTCLSFPEDFRRARKNSTDLFQQVHGRLITGIRTFPYDRSFAMDFEDAFTLVFKLYGNRSNILLFKKDNSCVDLFKHHLKTDLELKQEDFGRTCTLTQKEFEAVNQDYLKFLPALGKACKAFFLEREYDYKNPDEKWKMVCELLNQLDQPSYCISSVGGVPVLLLYPDNNKMATYSDPEEALNAFYRTYTRQMTLHNGKSSLIKKLHDKQKKNKNYIVKTREKLEQLKIKTDDAQIADVIMANLHHIPSHAKQVVLLNFYDNNKVTIKLKPHLSPQKNAEIYYRKSKNKKIELDNLKSGLKLREETGKELAQLLEQIEQVQEISQLRELTGNVRQKALPTSEEVVGYHKFEYMGYQILVGKNAKRNDFLTFKVAGKHDLWLHARDTPGSHVIIRIKPGGNIPRCVIERAASIAAFYSKRKKESLCPVMYTERKYVRKTKHLVDGQVIVEREKSILVKPHSGRE